MRKVIGIKILGKNRETTSVSFYRIKNDKGLNGEKALWKYRQREERTDRNRVGQLEQKEVQTEGRKDRQK